jgi:hypothetical protein
MRRTRAHSRKVFSMEGKCAGNGRQRGDALFYWPLAPITRFRRQRATKLIDEHFVKAKISSVAICWSHQRPPPSAGILRVVEPTVLVSSRARPSRPVVRLRKRSPRTGTINYFVAMNCSRIQSTSDPTDRCRASTTAWRAAETGNAATKRGPDSSPSSVIVMCQRYCDLLP